MEASKKQEVDETVKELENKLNAQQQKTNEYLTRLKYLQADFENYRKRAEKQLQESVNRSNEKLVACLINIIDDLESAISAGNTTENKAALLEGIKMVHKKLDDLLTKEGLERLECVGQSFDPNLHEILAQVPTKEHQSGTVLEEARKGFLFKGKVLRPSVVKIACETSESEQK
ncbi:MAG: nucleotide exchange factor GrpE [Candidatus Bathyarchaeum sp.]|nr:MAG: nucleotide exchange factor GrpE [Candidatus Bathyarchaeum sp.]